MPGAFSGKFWPYLGGVIAASIVGQVIWTGLAWNSSREVERPRFAPKANGKAAEAIPDRGAAKTPSNRRQIANPFPPMVDFAVESAQAIGTSIADAEYVLGVEIGGESRAYPLNMMGTTGNEILNDTLGGNPIAVTFCSLCEAPLVYSRRVDGKTLRFHITGELQDSNMVMGDQETKSKWLQVLGKSVEGPLEGKALERIPSAFVDWKTWRARHPSTTSIDLSRLTNKYSPVIPGTRLLKKPEFVDTLVWGLGGRDGAVSWPITRLLKERAVNESFEGRPLLLVQEPSWPGPVVFDRRLDDKTLTFRWEGDDLIDEPNGSAWDPSTGLAIRGPLQGRRLEPVPGTITRAKTWRSFHPDGIEEDPSGPAPEPKPDGL